jgi:CMP-N,N'-diacetyllegionaminic acid synthase
LIIGIIPARGGSKGISRKNLREVGGETLIARGLDLLKQTQCEKIYVSTDDNEIAKVSIDNGALVIHRPKELAEDQSSTESVLFHAVQELKLQVDDILVLHQITSPLIKKTNVEKAISILTKDKELNSVLSVREGHPFMWIQSGEDSWEPLGHSRDFRPRRQDLGVQAIETGGIYVMRVGALISQKSRFPEPSSVVRVSYLEAVDIDSVEDLEFANMILTARRRNQSNEL